MIKLLSSLLSHKINAIFSRCLSLKVTTNEIPRRYVPRSTAITRDRNCMPLMLNTTLMEIFGLTTQPRVMKSDYPEKDNQSQLTKGIIEWVKREQIDRNECIEIRIHTT